MHHSALGYSGTDGNAVWVHNNDFYDNTEGFSTDVFTAPGHPGFPQDSDLVENNNFYYNNFNTLPAALRPRPEARTAWPRVRRRQPGGTAPTSSRRCRCRSGTGSGSPAATRT